MFQIPTAVKALIAVNLGKAIDRGIENLKKRPNKNS